MIHHLCLVVVLRRSTWQCRLTGHDSKPSPYHYFAFVDVDFFLVAFFAFLVVFLVAREFS